MTDIVDIAPREPAPREYLGDGLYAEFDGYQIWLISSNGIQDLQRVAVDRDVYRALVGVASRAWGVRS